MPRTLTLLMILLWPACLLAVPVAITNPGFELPALSPGGSTMGTTPGWSIPGWTLTPFSGGAGGTQYLDHNPTYFTDGAPEGNSTLWVSAAYFTQTLTATLQPNTEYTLDVLVGRYAIVAETYSITLLAGDHVLATTSNTLLSIPIHTFQNRELTYTSTGTSPGLGEALRIVLQKNGGWEVDFDNVRLDAAGQIPEPGSAALFVVGIGALGAILRRRRAV